METERERAIFGLRREDNGLESLTIKRFTDIASTCYVHCLGCVVRKMRDNPVLLTVYTTFKISSAAQVGLLNAD
jgi:hypothetical protein